MGNIVKKGKGRHRFPKGNKFGGNEPVVKTLKAREFILACIGGDEGVKAIIMSAFKKAKQGSYKHQEILLNYLLGRPVESVKLDVSGSGALPSPTVVKIIADHLRLERLNKDAEAAPVITEDRIKEMEDTLNKHIDGKEIDE